MKVLETLKWLWQFPQNLLAVCLEGLLCNGTYRDKEKVDGNIIIRNFILPGCVSLGDYIFVSPSTEENTIQHECGHSEQSDILGPLYLIVVGLPSLMHCIAHSLLKKFNVTWDYYKFYTESWANKLAKIGTQTV